MDAIWVHNPSYTYKYKTCIPAVAFVIKDITKTFISGRVSATFIIPLEIARRHGLEQPAHVVMEETPQGILIRRSEV